MRAGTSSSEGVPDVIDVKVGRCRLTVSNLSRKRTWFQRLKVKCDEPLSNLAFKFNLRHYIEVSFSEPIIVSCGVDNDKWTSPQQFPGQAEYIP